MDSEAWRLLASEFLLLGVWVTEPWRDKEPFLTPASGMQGGRIKEGRGPGARRDLARVEECGRGGHCWGHWLHCSLYRRLVLAVEDRWGPEVSNRGRVLVILGLVTVPLVIASLLSLVTPV